ncbi:MAG: type III-B CRISPR-associated protein Cas10/Cmr2 [Firmicutes bacterium]|nr:type III-B CRISPR-associated protein Cas10/Cmr2 [Bacillota bacterium]MDD4336752.1 type III-B CRISPR-associated protein Cas10/Cmr2 [Bacillota bacterium]MDD4792703.1 type III-B CRISPR-associated protein Cas10/Cmr2 [Bacillota bacterium]
MEPIDGNKNPATESCGLRPEDHTGIAAHSPSSERVLDFTIAPVQGFVGQARRTRDFWAGSYLISYLTAHAIKAVLEVGATDHNETAAQTGSRIIFPHVDDDPLLAAVMGTATPQSWTDEGARIASLPNRFSAECYDPAAAGEAAAQAVKEVWRDLALAVWKAVRARLIRSFRYSDVLPELACEDCLPPTWSRQVENHWELYWVAGAGPSGVDQRKNWRQMHMFDETGEVCTMCGERVVAFGAELPRWQARQIWHGAGGIIDSVNSEGSSDKWDLALDPDQKERLCAVCMVKRIFPYIAREAIGWPVPVSFPSTHDLARRPGEKASSDAEDLALPYYAILFMDGDSMGKHLSSKPERTGQISKAISDFSRAVPQIVEREYHGRVVYAGGDDVLALLPVDEALDCAVRLRRAFEGSSKSSGVPMTISASILCVHAKSPLQAAFAAAHRLLDDIAKEGIGRDAFVIQVRKRGGSPLTIAKPWEGKSCHGAAERNDGPGWAERIDELSGQIFDSDGEGYSSRFLYSAAELLEPFARPAKECGSEGPSFEAANMIPVLAAEYLRGPGALLQIDWDESVRRMTELYDLCRWEPRESGKIRDRALQPDALPMVRFLAEAKGVK